MIVRGYEKTYDSEGNLLSKVRVGSVEPVVDESSVKEVVDEDVEQNMEFSFLDNSPRDE